MKKVLLIILIGFIVVSILTIMFTIQSIHTFRDFDEHNDNGDNNDDHYNDSNLDRVNTDGLNNFFLMYEAKVISTFRYPMWYCSFRIFTTLFIRDNIVNSLKMHKK